MGGLPSGNADLGVGLVELFDVLVSMGVWEFGGSYSDTPPHPANASLLFRIE